MAFRGGLASGPFATEGPFGEKLAGEGNPATPAESGEVRTREVSPCGVETEGVIVSGGGAALVGTLKGG